MLEGIIQLLGGIGLFLLGMSLMTDSLKELAGESLRQWLARFTGSPFKAIQSGIVFTLIVQSSTATTLATIGFVSAGVLTFAQSIGVIIGANIGTTSTGWMVALLGVKFSIGQFALPLIAVGALTKILGPTRWGLLGLSVAGFGLIFYGIELLQLSMSGLANRIDFSGLSTQSLIAQGLLVLVGLIMTIILQSSSAAITTTITALASQVIQLEQALLLVIGQNIGTVATAVLAALNAHADAKRTAAVHVFFNCISAVFAFFILVPLFLWMYQSSSWGDYWDVVIWVAAFHTAFSICGACLFMPFIKHIKALLYHWIPSENDSLLLRLDEASLSFPSVAISNTHNVMYCIIQEQLNWIVAALKSGHVPTQQQCLEHDLIVDRLETYLSRIVVSKQSQEQALLFDVLRLMVYLKVLKSDLEQLNYVEKLTTQPRIYQVVLDYLHIIVDADERVYPVDEYTRHPHLFHELSDLKKWIEQQHSTLRQGIHDDAARDQLNAAETLELLAALRWFERLVAHHQRMANVLYPSH